MTFFAELWARLRATTPPFFQILLRVFALVAGLGAVIAGIDALGQLPSWFKPDWYKNMVLVGGVGAFVAKLPVNWNTTSPADVPAVVPPVAVRLVKDVYDLPDDSAPTS